ncbi:hypothetical protein D9M72_406020 [compost metagenome]
MACRHVDRERLLRLLERHRQGIGRHFWHLQQFVVDEHTERAAELFGKRQHSDAVADAEGMIGDDDDRRVGQVPRRPLTLGSQLHIDELQHLAEDPIALADDVGPPTRVKLCVAIATRQTFDGANEPALQAPVVFIGVGQLFELHGHLRWI